MEEPTATKPPFSHQTFTREDLAQHVKSILGDRKVIVVANREPYRHERSGGEIRFHRPAGGVVTALDPVLRAVGGVWVAHGSGSADRITSDEKGRLEVPPNNPRYLLRRIWLTKDEERGYYFGFSNEALWPLCHLAYVRPEFREKDWEMYRAVNKKFAEAALEEAGDEPAIVIVQDYQLALVPLFLRQARRDIGIAQFWHIPWPNPEIFRICPWRHEILDGLLSNDLIGFHMQHFCMRFLDSVDSEMQTRIDRGDQSVFHGEHVSFVRTFGIGVDADEIAALSDSKEVAEEIAHLRNVHSLNSEITIVGVDRLDYTKGIPERLQAFDEFLNRHPEWEGRIQFVAVGAPSRIRLSAYQNLADRVEELVDNINWRHGSDAWQPVVYIDAVVNQVTTTALYRMSDLCLVTSLQDGMNLVAKEYVASRTNNDGVLLLSCFTGAAHDLTDAVLINPFDVEGMADAIHIALEMPEEERRRRMERMRERVFQRNVYDWARRLFSAAVRRADESHPALLP